MPKFKIRNLKLYFLILLLMATLAFEYFLVDSEVKDFRTVQGTIVDAQEHTCINRDRRRKSCWKDVIEYESSVGNKNRIVSDVYRGSYPNIGEHINVYVSPQNSNYARVGGFTGVFFDFYIHVIVISVFIFIISLFLFSDMESVRSRKLKIQSVKSKNGV
jgi:Protein of unknown function (DUF3592)